MLRILAFLCLASLACASPTIYPSSLYSNIFRYFGLHPSQSYSPIIPYSYSHQPLSLYYPYSNYFQQSLYQIPSLTNYVQPWSYLPSLTSLSSLPSLHSYDPYLYWWNFAGKNPLYVTIPQVPQSQISVHPSVPSVPVTPITPEAPIPENHVVTEDHGIHESNPHAEELVHEEHVKDIKGEVQTATKNDDLPVSHELGARAKVEHVPPFIQ